MDLSYMIADIHDEINSLRQLERLLATDEFRGFYEQLKDTTEIDYLIKARNLDVIRRRMLNIVPLDERPIKELRRIAMSLRIRDYNLKSKSTLVTEIEQCQMLEMKLQQSKSYTQL